MNQLVAQLAANVGIDKAVGKRIIGLSLNVPPLTAPGSKPIRIGPGVREIQRVPRELSRLGRDRTEAEKTR